MDASNKTYHSESLPEFIEKSSLAGTWDILVRVQPGAKKSELAGIHDKRLRIRLAAPAVENKANIALCAFIAKILKIRRSQVELISGDTGRQKRLRITMQTEPNWNKYFSLD